VEKEIVKKNPYQKKNSDGWRDYDQCMEDEPRPKDNVACKLRGCMLFEEPFLGQFMGQSKIYK